MSLNPLRNLFLNERVLEAESGAGIFQRGVTPHYKPEEIKDYFSAYLDYDIIRAPIDDLTEMAVGQGYFTSVDASGDKRNPSIKAKDDCDEFGRFHNLDEMLPNIVRISLIAGFCPVESKITPGMPEKSTLKIVHPETVTDIKSSGGKVLEITQEVGGNKNVIYGKDLAWFVYCQIANDPRGTSFVRGLLTILNTLNDATADVDKILKRYIGPVAIWKTRDSIESIKQAVVHRVPGQDIFIGGMRQEDVENPNMPQMITIDPRVPYWEYIEYLDRRIYASSSASNLYYIRNATQASAREMEAIVQRHVGSIQRDVKRAVEKFWFERLVGVPTPRIKFGIEKTGVEDIDPSMFLVKGVDSGLIQKDQYYDILRQMGLDVPEPKGEITPPKIDPKTQVTAPQGRGVVPEEMLVEMVGNTTHDYNAVYDTCTICRFHAQDMVVDINTLRDISAKNAWRYSKNAIDVFNGALRILEWEGYEIKDTMTDRLKADLSGGEN